MAEWNAQFLGDKAYQISEFEKVNLRWEARQFQAGRLWHRWDYPYSFENSLLEERNPVLMMHLVEPVACISYLGIIGKLTLGL